MITTNVLALVVTVGILIVTPGLKGVFEEPKEVEAYKRALDELTVPSASITKGRCYVEYRGKVYLDGACTIATGNAGVIAVANPLLVSIENLTAFVVETTEGGPRTAALNPITFKNLKDVWFGDVKSSDKNSCWSNQIGKICAWKEQ